MREILFRGKRVDNGEWVVGDLLQWHDDYCQIVRTDNRGGKFIAAPETIGQYTGLKDANGNKIFEGDIVKDQEIRLFGKVVFSKAENDTGYMIEDVVYGLQNYNGFWNCVEILGNIHDNPEMIKGGDDE